MPESPQHHGQWSSRIAFIIAASGSAIGLGNIWKFPYLLGENGGGAFVLVYIACVIGIGLPIMMAETMIGRRGQRSPIHTMTVLAKEANATPLWQIAGWLGVLAGFLILSYYSVIAGWSMAYLFKMVGGFMDQVGPEEAQQIFWDLKAAADVQLVWHSLFMALTTAILMKGLTEGIERVTRFMIPSLFLMLLALDIYAATTPGFWEGMTFLFKPDFSKITPDSLLIAMGQAFFSLGLGMGSIMIYGAYLPNNVSIGRSSVIISIADTAVALMAGIAIFPVVFSNHLPPSMGPGLIFETLPLAFSHMPLGALFGSLFFLLVFFAAITSAIALIEPAIAYLIETFAYSRQKASVLACGICWFLGLGTLGSFTGGSQWQWHGKTFFELIDFVTADVMLPLGGILIAVFAGWVMKEKVSAVELDLGRYHRYWQICSRYIAPLAVTLILLKALNLF